MKYNLNSDSIVNFNDEFESNFNSFLDIQSERNLNELIIVFNNYIHKTTFKAVSVFTLKDSYGYGVIHYICLLSTIDYKSLKNI